MKPQSGSQRPIGYWLKRADEVLTQHIDEALKAYGVTRFHWQVLNTMRESGRISQAMLFEAVQPFADRARLETILTDFENRGWIAVHLVDQNGNQIEGLVQNEDTGIKLELTDLGIQDHKDILSRQNEVRKRAMKGISEEEYMTVIRVLQRLVENLEQGPSSEN